MEFLQLTIFSILTAFSLPGSIKWRIGDLSIDGYAYIRAVTLPQLKGATAERFFVPDIKGHVFTAYNAVCLRGSAHSCGCVVDGLSATAAY